MSRLGHIEFCLIFFRSRAGALFYAPTVLFYVDDFLLFFYLNCFVLELQLYFELLSISVFSSVFGFYMHVH